MGYEKIVCWGADPDLQKKVSEEFTTSEVVLVFTFDDFKKRSHEHFAEFNKFIKF